MKTSVRFFLSDERPKSQTTRQQPPPPSQQQLQNTKTKQNKARPRRQSWNIVISILSRQQTAKHNGA